MKKLKSVAVLFTALLCTSFMFAQIPKVPVDYLSVPGPVAIEGKAYNLSWSSHPAADYYKQEYLVKGDNATRFKSMVMLEVLTGDVSVKNVVSAKIAELKKIKETNPVVNYEVFQKDGEYILDFILTVNGTNGSVDIIERNVYRYKTLSAKAGQRGLLLFAVSSRAYGKEADRFLIDLKATKNKLVDAVAKFIIPAINIRN